MESSYRLEGTMRRKSIFRDEQSCLIKKIGRREP